MDSSFNLCVSVILFLAVLWSPARKGLTSWLLCFLVFVTYPYGILDQVWFVILSIPGCSLLPFKSKK